MCGMGITCVEKAMFSKLRSAGFSANMPPKMPMHSRKRDKYNLVLGKYKAGCGARITTGDSVSPADRLHVFLLSSFCNII